MTLPRRPKTKPHSFEFVDFSTRQMQLMHFWRSGSPHRDCKYVIADGSVRSGKTIAMILSYLTWSWETFDHGEFIIAGKSMSALKRNVVTPMLQILDTLEIKYHYHRTENTITVGTYTYRLFGASTEASYTFLQGFTASGAYADEAALMPQSFVNQMITRCSVAGSKIFFNCNPSHPLHYIKTEFIDKRHDKNILYLKFCLDDNLSLAEETKQLYKSSFSGVFYKRYIDGEWVRAEGVIYDMFDESQHVVSELPKRFSEYSVSIDYGTRNPCVFLMWGKSGKTWYCIREYYYDSKERQKQKTDEEYFADFERFIEDGTDDFGQTIRLDLDHIVVDPSAASFITRLEKGGYSVTKGKNDVADGIRMCSDALMLKQVLIYVSCKHFISEAHTYAWDEKADGDVPLKVDDHIMDAWRYFVMTVIKSGHIGWLT